MNILSHFKYWKVTALDTGSFWLDGGAMMGSVPKVLWEKENFPDELNRIKLSMRCLLLDDGKNIVLIETGIGNKFNNKFKDMFSIEQSTFPISDSLNQAGYTVENITHVILTHLHFDHAGGATIFNNNELIPTFPNAEYFISKKNWEAAINPNPKDRASYLSENFISLKEKSALHLIDDNVNILDGISTYIVNGHTYGQQLVKINDGDESLIFCSDLIPLKSQLRIPWIMGYDLNASLTLKEKTTFLNFAADRKWWLFFYHDPNYVAVQIKKADTKYYDINQEILA